MSAQRNSSGAFALLLPLNFKFVTRCIFKKHTEDASTLNVSFYVLHNTQKFSPYLSNTFTTDHNELS
jgi:hypothetical protein